MMLTVKPYWWRRNIEGASPQLGLLVTVLCRRLLLVQTLKCSVVPLVPAPTAFDRQPNLPESFESKVTCQYGTSQERGVGHIKYQPGFFHGQPSRNGFGFSLWGERHVMPPREEVELVPRGLSMAEQHELAEGGIRGHENIVGCASSAASGPLLGAHIRQKDRC